MGKKNGGGVTRVFVAATSAVRRSGLEAIIRENPEYSLVGSAPGVLGLAERLRTLQADVVLVDLPHPELQFSSVAASL